MVTQYTPAAPGKMDPAIYRELQRIATDNAQLRAEIRKLQERIEALEAAP